MWPKATHGFFMHPPLLKSTAGGRKNRMKSALEGGSRRKRQHECPICHQFGHRWYTCKNGNPEDKAAMEALRGPPKKRVKKASSSDIETSIVVATPASGMVFPHNEAVDNATHKKRKRKPSSSAGVNKRKGPETTTTHNGNSVSTRSGTGSNDPFPVQMEHPPIIHQDAGSCEASQKTVQTPRKKRAIMKKLTPKRAPVEIANPSSPASNTRSKKKLKLD
ncbi:unnamed protein product [Urochloa humidicola]